MTRGQRAWSTRGSTSGEAAIATSTVTCAAALAAVALSACTITVPDQAADRARVTGVELSPVAPGPFTVEAGGSLALHATVHGTGPVPQAVRWSVRTMGGTTWDVAGQVDAAGVYRVARPSIEERVDLVTATSLADGFSAATVAMTVPALSVSIEPPGTPINIGASRKLAATVRGAVDKTVTWSCSVGTIDPDGTYHAPQIPNYAEGTVTARVAMAGVEASDTVRVAFQLDPPVLLSAVGSLGGDTTLEATASGVVGWVAVVLHDLDLGGQETVEPAFSVEPGRLRFRVPPGAWARQVELRTWTFLPQRTSNTVTVLQPAATRPMADRLVLAAGETTRLRAAVLGDAAAGAVTWQADVGTLAGDVYTAPAVVDAPGVAHLQACAPGATGCESLLLRLVPFRAEPDPAEVVAGGSLALAATSAGAPHEAAWSVGGGGGTASASGLFTAPIALLDAGSSWLLAGDGRTTAAVQVATTGLSPGLLASFGEQVPAGTDRRAGPTAMIGQRAFVTGTYPGSDGGALAWIDGWDLADPMHPIWLGAAGLDFTPVWLQAAGDRLYAMGSRYGGRGLDAAVLDAGAAPPVVLARWHRVMRATSAESTTRPVADPLRGLFTFWSPDAISRTFTIELGDATSSTMVLPLPADATARTLVATLANGTVYGAYEVAGGGARIAAWSLETGALLGTAGGAAATWCCTLDVAGPLLVGSGGCWDIRGGLPVPVACSFGKRQVRASGPGEIAVEVPGGLLAVDLSDPSAPVERALVGGAFGNGALAGGHYVGAVDGRFSVVDLGPVGGPLPRPTVPQAISLRSVSGAIARGGILYAGGAGALYQDGLVGAWDLSAHPPAPVWSQASPSTVLGVALAGDLLVSIERNGLVVRSLQDPLAPAVSGSLPLDGTAVVADGGVAWVASNYALVAVDVSTPTAPLELGQLALPCPVTALAVLSPGRIVAATRCWGGGGSVVVVDGARPATPALLGTLSVEAGLVALALDGTTAVGGSWAGLFVVDLADPGRPVLAARVSHETTAERPVFVDGGLAWIGPVDSDRHLRGYDLRRPAWPRLVSLAAAAPGAVVIAGRALWLVDGAVTEWDLSRPRNVVREPAPAFSPPGVTPGFVLP